MKVTREQVLSYWTPKKMNYSDLTTYCKWMSIDKNDHTTDFLHRNIGLSDFFVRSYACFRYFFSDVRGSNERFLVKIRVNHYNDAGSDFTKNHCWMRIDQFYEHINYIRKTLDLDFEFLIKDTGEYYVVVLDTKQLNGIQIKFVCTWIRYSYEFPANLALYDAYRMKETERWKDYSIFNLFLLPARYLSAPSLYDDQCISTRARMISNDFEYLKARLSNNNAWWLSQLYPVMIPHQEGERLFVWGYLSEQIKANYNFMFMQYWLDEGNLAERINEIYPKTEEFIKQIRVEIDPETEEARREV